MIRSLPLTDNSIGLVRVCLFLFGSQVAFAQDTGQPDRDLAFEQVSFQQMREGYFTLRWNPIAGAIRYEVVDQNNVVMLSGSTIEAFLSGLEDGEYRYRVRAFDASGTLLAESSQTADVQVEHWSMRLVSTLFAIGFIVVLAVAMVLIVGTKSSIAPLSGSGANRSEAMA